MTENTTPIIPNLAKESRFAKFRKSFVGEIIQIVVISLIIVIPFRTYIAQPFLVSGPSMDNTFANGQYLIVDELTYNLREPERGEVVIFHYPLNTKVFYIKRVIGLPGETIQIKDGKVTICKPDCETDKNKFILQEPYIKPAGTTTENKLEAPKISLDNLVINKTLKENEYFVMGDNRAESYDSRMWGPVKRDLMTGRPFIRLLPLNKISLFPGQFNNY